MRAKLEGTRPSETSCGLQPQLLRVGPGAVAFAAVVVTYMPLLFFRYGLYDDYLNGQNALEEILRTLTADGRPIGGLLEAGGFGLTGQIDGFVYLRAVAIIAIAIQAGLLARLLARRLHSPSAGTAISYIAHVTVGVQMVSAWGTTLYVAPIASLLSGGGAWILWNRTSESASRKLLGCIFVLIGLATYQPSGMAAVGIVVILVATDEGPAHALLTKLKSTFLWLAATAAAYVGVWKICQHLVPRTGQRGQLVSDLSAKGHWFLGTAVPRVLHPFSLSSGGLLTGLLVLAAILVAPYQPRDGRGFFSVKIALVVVGLVGCFTPNLVAAESWASARSLWIVMIAATTTACIGVFRLARPALDRSPKTTASANTSIALRLVAALLCLCLGRLALANVVEYVAEPNSVELRAVQAQMRIAIHGNPVAIVLITADWGHSIAPGVSYDEFGFPATAASWAIIPMVNPIIRETNYAGQVSVRSRTELSPIPKGAVVIDLNQVLESVDSR